MAISKVIYGSQTLLDLTADTVTAESMTKGYTAHAADGSQVTGTLETVTYYSGTSDPTGSIGSDGDVYFKVSS